MAFWYNIWRFDIIFGVCGFLESRTVDRSVVLQMLNIKASRSWDLDWIELFSYRVAWHSFRLKIHSFISNYGIISTFGLSGLCRDLTCCRCSSCWWWICLLFYSKYRFVGGALRASNDRTPSLSVITRWEAFMLSTVTESFSFAETITDLESSAYW